MDRHNLKTARHSLHWPLGAFLGLCGLVAILIWFTTDHHQDLESADVQCSDPAKILDPDKPLKVLTWNIQFLAGKNYIFFYDAIDGSGKDERPLLKDTQVTLAEMTRVIKEEDPDLLLLQEVDVDAKRTDHQDQVELLRQALAPRFPCVASTYYWRAKFLPHPKIMGSIGMKLATFSKFRIEKAERHALGEFPTNFLDRQFRPKRAVLDSHLPTTNGKTLRVLNTHLEAYSQGSNLMQYQVNKIKSLLETLEKAQIPWLLGGDFNLLMPGRNYNDLSPSQRSLYQEHSELKVLTDRFKVIPSLLDVNGELHREWYTHFPNDPEVKGPDRTIDYNFYGTALHPKMYRVRSHDTQKISDHLPLLAEFQIDSKTAD